MNLYKLTTWAILTIAAITAVMLLAACAAPETLTASQACVQAMGSTRARQTTIPPEEARNRDAALRVSYIAFCASESL